MGATRRSWPREARAQSLASRATARRRPLVMRARMTARSAVPLGEEGEARGRGAFLNRGGELLAVVDQLADQAEHPPYSARPACADLTGVWLGRGGDGA
jgi:hypothetical protein